MLSLNLAAAFENVSVDEDLVSYPNHHQFETPLNMSCEEMTKNESLNTGGQNNTTTIAQYYIEGVLAVIVIFLGLVGNFLTVVVLTRRTMHSSTNFFLTALAIWDMLVLVCTSCIITFPQLSSDFRQNILPYMAAYVYPLALVAQTSTIWITVSFTVERYIAVCHPLKAATMCTTARARIVIFCVSLSSILYNMCRWFEYKVVNEEVKDCANRTVINISFAGTKFLDSLIYKKVYFLYFYPFVMFIIPLLTLAILNTFLVMAVKRSQRQQKDMNVRQSRENNVTLMLVSVVVVFMFCQVPAMVYNVAISIDEPAIQTGWPWQVLSSIRNFLVTFNSAINFILYCAFGQKFRRIFIRTFCSCLIDENDFNSITFHATVGTLAKGEKSNKMYTRLLKSHGGGRGGNHIEMSSNVTQHTLLSKYSPCVSRTPSPCQEMRKFPNGRQKVTDSQTAGDSGGKLIPNSETPSPV